MYHRILLKLSGEALSEKQENSIFNPDIVKDIAKIIAELHNKGIEVGVVIGGGNIWRGKLANQIGIEESQAHYMGMVATIINAVAMANAVRALGVPSVVFTALGQIPEICEVYNKDQANQLLSEGKVCFYAAGTGKPFFSTDTGSTLRAIETNCEAVFMAKNGVDGIYNKDPNVYKDAKFFKDLTYKEVIDMKLGVMDISAVELIKDTNIEIRVFNMNDTSNILKVANGSDIGTTVRR